MYTAISAPQLENEVTYKLERMVQEIRKRIPYHALTSILLAGGYGRHEGGVLEEDGKLRLHNNLDVVVIVETPGDRKRYQRILEWYQPTASEMFGVDVDLSINSLQQVMRNQHTMFWYDTLRHHVSLYSRNIDWSSVPEQGKQPSLEAGLTLVTNRGALLFLNKELARQPHAKSEQTLRLIQKHLVKATIGLGDIYLLLAERYTPSYRQRLDDFKRFPSILPNNKVRNLVIQAIQRRFEPYYTQESLSELLERNEMVLEAYRKAIELFEASRTKKPFQRAQPGRHYQSVVHPKQRVSHILRNPMAFAQPHPQDTCVLQFMEQLYQTDDALPLAWFLKVWGGAVDTNFKAFLQRYNVQLPQQETFA